MFSSVAKMLASRTADEVVDVVGSVLADDVVGAEHLPTGFGNENWRLTLSSGARCVAKFGPLSSEPKWRSAQEAHRLARAAGVPVARLIHFERSADSVLRIFEWVDGMALTEIESEGADAARFFSDLGRAVGALHSVEIHEFGSRLDGSAPAFGRWADYVEYRLGQIRARCRSTDAFGADDLDRICAAIQRRADLVSDAARPALCHRDLHGDNLLVGKDGALAAVLDFDQAERWDSAADWCKLDWMVFPTFPPECRESFAAAYRSIHPDAELWEERKTGVDLIEAFNGVPNAIAQGWGEFERVCRSRLAPSLS
jgi:aminoglycoside phosphotransferase (APT) family kinase protein